MNHHFYEDYDRYRDPGQRRNDWRSTDLHFGQRPTERHYSDFSDEGLATRSHRMGRLEWDRPGIQEYGYGPSEVKTGHFGRGPKGYQRSDDRIKEDVCEVLFRHNNVDASGIDVSVKEGVVTLSGTIETRSMKREAEMAIENISGVEDIQNTLRIQPEGITATATSKNQKLA